jgi:toxin HigB-1
MIRSFRCSDTEALFRGSCPPRFLGIRARAERKLAMLDAAVTLAFLASPPGNRLERLRADRLGSWSIRINERWRLCFRFEGGDAFDVEIVDYHR